MFSFQISHFRTHSKAAVPKIDYLSISNKIALRWMLQIFADVFNVELWLGQIVYNMYK